MNDNEPDITEEELLQAVESFGKPIHMPRGEEAAAEGYAQALDEAGPLTKYGNAFAQGVGNAVSTATLGLIPSDLGGKWGASEEDRRMMEQGTDLAVSRDLGMQIASGAGAAAPATLGLLSGRAALAKAVPALAGEGWLATALGIGAVGGTQAAIAPEVQRRLHDDPTTDERSLAERVLWGGGTAAVASAVGGAIAPMGSSFTRQVIGGSVTDASLSVAQHSASDWQGEDAPDLQRKALQVAADVIGGAFTNVPMAAATGRGRVLGGNDPGPLDLSSEIDPPPLQLQSPPRGTPTGDQFNAIQDARGAESVPRPVEEVTDPGFEYRSALRQASDVAREKIDVENQRAAQEAEEESFLRDRESIAEKAIADAEQARKEAEDYMLADQRVMGRQKAEQRDLEGNLFRAEQVRSRIESALRADRAPSDATFGRLRNAMGSAASHSSRRTGKPVAEEITNLYGTLSRQFRERAAEAGQIHGSNTERAARRVMSDEAVKHADSIRAQGELVAKQLDMVAKLDNPSYTSMFLGERVAYLQGTKETMPIARTELGALPSLKELKTLGVFRTHRTGIGQFDVNAEAAREYVDSDPRLKQLAKDKKLDVGTKDGFEKFLDEALKQPDIRASQLVSDLLGYGKGARVDPKEATHLVIGKRNGGETNSILTMDPGEAEYILKTRHGADAVEVLPTTQENMMKFYGSRLSAIEDPALRAYWQKEIDNVGKLARQANEASTAREQAPYIRRTDEVRSASARVGDELDAIRLARDIGDDTMYDADQYVEQIKRMESETKMVREMLPDIAMVDADEAGFIEAKIEQTEERIAKATSDLERIKAPPQRTAGYQEKQVELIQRAAESGEVPKAMHKQVARDDIGRDVLLAEISSLSRRQNESIEEWEARLTKVRDTAKARLDEATRSARLASGEKPLSAAMGRAAVYEAMLAATQKHMIEIAGDPASQGVQKLNSGIPLPEGLQIFFDQKVVPFVRGNLEAMFKSVTKPGAARDQVAELFDAPRVGLAKTLEKIALHPKNPYPAWSRKVAEFLDLPSPHEFMRRDIEPAKAKLFDQAKNLVSKFEYHLSALSPEDQVTFWRAADSGSKNDIAPKHHNLLASYHAAMDRIATIMVRGGALDPDAFARLRGRYVERMPGKNTAKLEKQKFGEDVPRTEAEVSKVLRRAYARASLESGGRAGSIGDAANRIRQVVNSRTSQRRPYTTEQAEELGYLKGMLPIIQTLKDESTISATFRLMEKVKEHPEARPYWKTLEEAVKEGLIGSDGKLTDTAQKQWIMANHVGYGVMRDHVIHQSLYGQLGHSLPEARSGWGRLMSELSGAAREGVTTFAFPGYHLVSVLDNVFHWAGAGLSPIKVPQRLAQFSKAMAEHYRSGTMDETLRDLLDLGLYREGLTNQINQGAEEAIRPDFRNVTGSRTQYLRNFFEQAGVVWNQLSEERKAVFATRRPGFRGAAGTIPWTMADIVKTWRSSIAGVDINKLLGITKNSRVRASGEGLRDLQSLTDLAFKYAAYRELREHGSGMIAPVIRSVLGSRVAPAGLSREQAAKILKQWGTTETLPTPIKTITGIPGTFAFMRFPAMEAWNLFGRGYAVDNPLGAALILSARTAIAGAGTWMASQVYGVSEEELERMKTIAADGDEDRAEGLSPAFMSKDPNGDPMMMMVDFGRLGLVDYLGEAVMPWKRVDPRHGEKAIPRFMRGIAASDPMTSQLYEAVTGTRASTGKSGDELYPTSLPEKIAGTAQSMGVPLAASVNRLVKGNELNNRMERSGQEPYSTNLEQAITTATALPVEGVSVEGTPRRLVQEQRAARRKNALDEAKNDKLEFRKELMKPKLPNDPTDAEIDEYIDKLEEWTKAKQRRKTSSAGVSEP